MAVFIDEATKVVVQGLTGREGKFHALRNREYGTKVVAGTRPGKGGEEVEGIPIFNTCLLYTSPSPRDRSLSRMPSSA